MMDTHRMVSPAEAAGRDIRSPSARAQPGRRRLARRLVDQAIGGHAQLTTIIRQRNPPGPEGSRPAHPRPATLPRR